MKSVWFYEGWRESSHDIGFFFTFAKLMLEKTSIRRTRLGDKYSSQHLDNTSTALSIYLGVKLVVLYTSSAVLLPSGQYNSKTPRIRVRN